MKTANARFFGATALVGALIAAPACAQQRPATEAEARYYVYGGFLTQAAPGIISERTALGPELRRQLALPPGADPVKVYEALIGLIDNKPLQVRKATPEEVANYSARASLDMKHPLYTLEAGDIKLLIQYDLEAQNSPFIGRLGVPGEAPPQPKKKPAIVTFNWIELFEYNKATLTPEARAKLDGEVIPKLMEVADIRYINVNGHSDERGSAQYNQKLSEKRAEAVRAYLVSKGANAAKIQIFGFGMTLPVKSCPNEKNRSALIECLAPNRRVVIEIEGTPR